MISQKINKNKNENIEMKRNLTKYLLADQLVIVLQKKNLKLTKEKKQKIEKRRKVNRRITDKNRTYRTKLKKRSGSNTKKET